MEFNSKENEFDFYWKHIFDGLNYNPIEFSVYRFDESLSLPAKFNKLYEMFKQLALNNQQVMDYLKEFVKNFDENLYESVNDVLSVWLENGQLAEIIRVAINDEVIEARTPFGGTPYASLSERLDNQIGKNTDFREFEDSSFMQRVSNEMTERGRNIRWFGAEIDNPNIDSHEAIQTSLDLGGAVVLPKGALYVSDTIIWDVYKSSIINLGATIIPTFTTPNKPVIKIISSNYENRQAQRNVAKSGFEIRGNGTCLGIELDSPSVENGVIAHLDFHNFVIRDCDTCILFGSNTYMVTFKSGEFARSRRLLAVKNDITNAGERIVFEDCNLTGSHVFDNSMVIDMPVYFNFYFINCSIDWNKYLGRVAGIVHLIACHVESPSYALSPTEPFLNLIDNGQFIMDGGTFMLNNDSKVNERIDLTRLISSTNTNQSINIEKTVWAVPNLKLLSDGAARVNFKPIFTQGYPTDVVHFILSKTARQNMLFNPGFYRAGTSTTNLYDDWQNAYGWQMSIEQSGDVKALRFTRPTTRDDSKIFLSVPFDPNNNSIYFSSLFEVYSDESNVITDASIQLYSDDKMLAEYSVGAIPTTAFGWRTIRIPQLLFGKPIPIKHVNKVRVAITCNMTENSFIQFRNPVINMC